MEDNEDPGVTAALETDKEAENGVGEKSMEAACDTGCRSSVARLSLVLGSMA